MGGGKPVGTGKGEEIPTPRKEHRARKTIINRVFMRPPSLATRQNDAAENCGDL
jgi:hypothetical protein